MNGPATGNRLQDLSIAWFALAMGLGGLTLAWRMAEELMGLRVAVSTWLLGLTTLLFVLLGAAYAAKALKHWEAIAAEWAHPRQGNFVPLASVALILLAMGWLPLSAPYSKLLWLLGSSLHLIFTLHIITRWMRLPRIEVVHMDPAWLIVVVGNVLVPVAGVSHAPSEVSWFFFSIGMLFWPVLLTLFFYRVIFHDSAPERIIPGLAMLIAPPAMGFVAYIRLTGGLDMLAMVLYHGSLFLTLLFISQLIWLPRLRFALAWWAYAFPLAAMALASFTMYEQGGSLLFARLASVLLGIATVVMAGLFLRTARAMARGEILPEA